MYVNCHECKTRYLIDEVCYHEDGRFMVVDAKKADQVFPHRRLLNEGKQLLVACPVCLGIDEDEDDINI